MNRKPLNIINKFCIICIIVLSISAFLSGCVKDSEFKELEERVAKLEEQSQKDNTENVVSISSDIINNTSTEIQNCEDDSLEPVSPSDSKYNYIITDWSSEEIVQDVLVLLDTVPQKGDTEETFPNSYKVKPYSAYLGNPDVGFISSFMNADYLENPDEDIIVGVTIDGVYTEMDGSLGVRDSRKITVSLAIIDYDKAEEIFDSFYAELQKMDTCSAEGKTGTYWSAYGKDRETANEMKIQMDNLNPGCYTISITKIIY